MKQFLSIIFLSAAITLLYSCQKEYSAEGGIVTGGGNTNGGTSEGTLGGTPGACANASLSGVYGQGLPLTDSIYNLKVQVKITKAGTYTIGTDTVNGVYFSKSGNFTDTGIQIVTLKAFGSPSNPGVFISTVKYKGSSCSFEVEVLAVAVTNGNDYFPTTANSSWTYNNDLAIPPLPDTFRVTSTGALKDFAGNSYSVFVSTPGTDSAFYRKGSGLYHEYINNLVIPGSTNTVSGEYTFLKDNVPANSQWESAEFPVTLGVIPTKVKVRLTLMAKNVNKIIGRKVYANVMVVKRELQVLVLTAYQTVDASEEWYAKGIGLINDKGVAFPYTNDILTYKVF